MLERFGAGSGQCGQGLLGVSRSGLETGFYLLLERLQPRNRRFGGHINGAHGLIRGAAGGLDKLLELLGERGGGFCHCYRRRLLSRRRGSVDNATRIFEHGNGTCLPNRGSSLRRMFGGRDLGCGRRNLLGWVHELRKARPLARGNVFQFLSQCRLG